VSLLVASVASANALIIHLFGVETAQEMGVDEDLIDRVTRSWNVVD
jgi:hypothetical protein